MSAIVLEPVTTASITNSEVTFINHPLTSSLIIPEENHIYTSYDTFNYQLTSHILDKHNLLSYQLTTHHPSSYYDYILQPVTSSNVMMFNCNSYRRVNNMHVRKPAKDMESLKMQIRYAKAGTEQVRFIILSCTFQPREMAFTALINLCGKLKDSEKAKEVFDTMIKYTDLRPNTYTYSALISAYVCSSQIDKALDIFEDMKKVSSRIIDVNDHSDSDSDSDCKPNHVTYCALVTACQRYGKFINCLNIYHEMSDAGYIPDKVTFMALISATESLEDWDKMEIYMESLHQQKFIASIATYTKMLYFYASKNNPDKALKLFLKIQELGVNVDSASCTALMTVLEKGSELDTAMDLIRSMTEMQVPINLSLLNSAMRMAASSFDYAKCLFIFQTIINNHLFPDSETLTPIIQSFRQNSFNLDADELSTIEMKLSNYIKF